MLGADGAHLAAENLVAFRYPSMEAAQAYAESNRVQHGHASWQVATADGVFGVVEFTPGPPSTPREREYRHAQQPSDGTT